MMNRYAALFLCLSVVLPALSHAKPNEFQRVGEAYRTLPKGLSKMNADEQRRQVESIVNQKIRFPTEILGGNSDFSRHPMAKFCDRNPKECQCAIRVKLPVSACSGRRKAFNSCMKAKNKANARYMKEWQRRNSYLKRLGGYSKALSNQKRALANQSRQSCNEALDKDASLSCKPQMENGQWPCARWASVNSQSNHREIKKLRRKNAPELALKIDWSRWGLSPNGAPIRMQVKSKSIVDLSYLPNDWRWQTVYNKRSLKRLLGSKGELLELARRYTYRRRFYPVPIEGGFVAVETFPKAEQRKYFSNQNTLQRPFVGMTPVDAAGNPKHGTVNLFNAVGSRYALLGQIIAGNPKQPISKGVALRIVNEAHEKAELKPLNKKLRTAIARRFKNKPYALGHSKSESIPFSNRLDEVCLRVYRATRDPNLNKIVSRPEGDIRCWKASSEMPTASNGSKAVTERIRVAPIAFSGMDDVLPEIFHYCQGQLLPVLGDVVELNVQGTVQLAESSVLKFQDEVTQHQVALYSMTNSYNDWRESRLKGLTIPYVALYKEFASLRRDSTVIRIEREMVDLDDGVGPIPHGRTLITSEQCLSGGWNDGCQATKRVLLEDCTYKSGLPFGQCRKREWEKHAKGVNLNELPIKSQTFGYVRVVSKGYRNVNNSAFALADGYEFNRAAHFTPGDGMRFADPAARDFVCNLEPAMQNRSTTVCTEDLDCEDGRICDPRNNACIYVRGDGTSIFEKRENCKIESVHGHQQLVDCKSCESGEVRYDGDEGVDYYSFSKERGPIPLRSSVVNISSDGGMPQESLYGVVLEQTKGGHACKISMSISPVLGQYFTPVWTDGQRKGLAPSHRPLADDPSNCFGLAKPLNHDSIPGSLGQESEAADYVTNGAAEERSLLNAVTRDDASGESVAKTAQSRGEMGALLGKWVPTNGECSDARAVVQFSKRKVSAWGDDLKWRCQIPTNEYDGNAQKWSTKDGEKYAKYERGDDGEKFIAKMSCWAGRKSQKQQWFARLNHANDTVALMRTAYTDGGTKRFIKKLKRCRR